MRARQFRLIALLALLGVVLLAPVALSAQALYLKNSAEVEGGRVSLGQLGRLQGAPESEGLLLFEALRAPRYLSASELQEALRNRRGANLRVFGAGVWIIPQNRRLDAAALQTLLETSIRRAPGGAELLSRHRIAVGENAVALAPEEGVELRFHLPARIESLNAGRRILALDGIVTDGQGRSRTLFRRQVPVQILARLTVAVARRDLAIGERLGADDYRIEEREFDDLTERYPHSNLNGMRVMAGIRSGELLTAANVQTQPAVRRGQSMDLTYQTDGIVLRVRCTAMGEGEPGQHIRVRPLFPASRRTDTVLTARILDERTVVVEGNRPAAAEGGEHAGSSDTPSGG